MPAPAQGMTALAGWTPAFCPKMRQCKKARAVSVSGLCETALVPLSQKVAGHGDPNRDILRGLTHQPIGGEMGLQSAEDSESRFARYVEGLMSVIGHADRSRP